VGTGYGDLPLYDGLSSGIHSPVIEAGFQGENGRSDYRLPLEIFTASEELRVEGFRKEANVRSTYN